MARGGITKTEVEQARDALLARGVSASIDAIRTELGNTGSKTTIHRYLKELEEAGKGKEPVSLSDELSTLVCKLSERLQHEAHELIETERKRHAESLQASQEQIEKQKEELLHSKTELDKLHAQQSQVEEKNQKLGDENQGYKLTVERLTVASASQQQRLDEKDAQIASLEKMHIQARDSLNHYRESVKEQREQDNRRFELQVQQLQAELRRVNQTLTVRQHEHADLEKQNVKLETQLSDALNRSEALKVEAQKKEELIGELNSQNTLLNVQANAANTLNQQSETKINSLQGLLEQATHQVQELKLELNQEKSTVSTQKEIMEQWFSKFEVQDKAKQNENTTPP